LKKASQDEITLDALLEEPKVGDEVFGFHCQQAVEKLLKAVLAAKGVAFRRTHDLEALFGLLENAGAPLPDELQASRLFTGFAVQYRYADWPGRSGSMDRRGARALVEKVRRWAEERVG
jgi:HEPN domain-containing protein